MTKLIASTKAIITRVLFGAHGAIAIWQVAGHNPIYWYFCVPIGLLFLEGLFTLAIKKAQEWRWFCPSVFLYLSSVVPAIWLMELDKIDRRLRFEKEAVELNLTAIGADLKKLDKLLGVQIKLPDIQVDPSMWVTLIEQFLMLILIIGRWMLPKGDLTRDQLSQLLLVYIGTAADIIEFFDSYKDNAISSEKRLVFLTLGIWSWSLMQFTIVLSATKSKTPTGASSSCRSSESSTCCEGYCCSIDIWGITLNMILQDAPFLAFRLLIIIHYKIITYMNVFFTCKNTLVIMLQLYRLYVVQAENRKARRQRTRKSAAQQIRQQQRRHRQYGSDELDIYTITKGRSERAKKRNAVYDIIDEDSNANRRRQKSKQTSTKKDTGYSTASDSDTSYVRIGRSGGGRKGKKCGHRSDGEKMMQRTANYGRDDNDGFTGSKCKRSKRIQQQHGEVTRRRHSGSDETKKEKKINKRRLKAKALEESALESQCSMSSNHHQVVHEKKHKAKLNLSSSSSHSSD